ncbi:DUF551 domain-containing protein [Klebsiella pneumoniae]|uniref:DUF551 domain-containing protein n=1 Tax=Klebsiella pneumoniae TaxID=573 RepID=UPI003C787F80
MDSEPVELPLDYLQGHKDGLEWAAQLAEANHPETGDWLYDDPIELAKAIRKGPDMPPVQPVADSEPAAEITEDLGRLFVKIHYPTTLKAGDKLYRHAQPAPVVEREPIAWLNDAYLARGVVDGEVGSEDAGPGYIPVYREAGPQPAPVVPEEKPIPNTLSMYAVDAVAAIAEVKGWNACRAAMLAAAPQSPGSEPATVPGKWIPVSEQKPDCWCLTCRPVTLNDMRFVVCPDCGNKRCPRANDHRNACTRSNEPGQEGSAYPAAPQEVRGE